MMIACWNVRVMADLAKQLSFDLLEICWSFGMFVLSCIPSQKTNMHIHIHIKIKIENNNECSLCFVCMFLF